MKSKYIFMVMILFSIDSFAISLEELQNRAVESRVIVNKYLQNVKMAQNDVQIAKSGYLPSVDLSYSLNALNEDTLFEQAENSTITGSITYNIFAGYRDKNNIESSQKILNSKEFQVQSIKQDIKRTVALYFTDIYAKRAVVEVSKKSYDAYVQLFSEGEKRFEVGIINKSDLLKIKVEQDNAYIDLQRAQANLEASINELKRATNEPIKLDKLDFSIFNTIPKVNEIEKNKNIMLEKRSDIRILKEIIKASQYQIGIANSTYYPSLDIAGIYKRYDDNFISGNGNGLQNDEVRVQLTLSYNLFDGKATDAKSAKAKAYEYSLRDDLKDLEETLVKELKNIYLDYEVSKRNIEVTLTGIKQADENLRIAKLSAEEGLITTSDLLDAITNLARAKTNSINAQSALFASYYNITRLIENY